MIFRKVEYGELSVILQCGLVIGACSLFQLVRRETSKMYFLLIDHDLSSEKRSESIHPSVSTFAGGIVPTAISHILSASGYTKVVLAIIQRLRLINMVNMEVAAPGDSHYKAGQRKFLVASFYSNTAKGIEGLHFGAPLRVPSILGSPFKIFRIDKRNLALRERQFTVGLFRGCHSLSNQRLGFAGVPAPTPSF